MKALSDIRPIAEWLPQAKFPLVIAGPCSAETEEQVLATAHEIKKNPLVSVYRAGVWKPRTRPNSFEGNGEPALQWLQKVKKETGLLVTTEIATAQHAEEALKHGIDILWVGARTTANPFSVQEIADVLKGTDVPVLVKNPINPDLQLWIGALERIYNAGIRKLAAIHRGFSSFEKTKYRNIPEWSIPIELKTQFPQIPIICDPSHISGNTLLLLHVAQKAMDLHMDGLMIETHINPKEAWSDAKQQVTPDELYSLLTALETRKDTANDADFQSKLETLRAKVDKLDRELVEKLAERMELVRQIGKHKYENQITILQVKRWKDILDKTTKLANDLGLSPELVKQFYTLVHTASISLQEEIFQNNEQAAAAKQAAIMEEGKVTL
jgi:chorismate mutase